MMMLERSEEDRVGFGRFLPVLCRSLYYDC